MDQVMKGWKSFLLWEGLPFLLPMFIFGLISVFNLNYESKLITLDKSAADWIGVHMGLIFLAFVTGGAAAASFILFIVRITQPKSNSGWYRLFSLILVSIFLIFPALFIIILGPAGITMMEQMREMPK